MNEPVVPPAAPAQAPVALSDEAKSLKDITEHLQSIRSMLKFFTLIVVLAIIGQVLSFLTHF